MKHIYLDTNVVDRLVADAAATEIIISAQRRHRLRTVIGYRLILELAGAVQVDSPIDDGLRSRAKLARDLLSSGGNVGVDGIQLAAYAVHLAPTKRWKVSPVFPRDSKDHQGALTTLELIVEDSNRQQTCDWYARNIGDQQSFYERMKVVRAKIRDQLPANAALVAEGGICGTISRLEAAGWIQSRVKYYAEQIGLRRRIANGTPLDWFGPLGRLVRGEVALLILRSISSPQAPRRKERLSDMSDVAHIVVAGMVGCFVTDDEEAALLFAAAWPERRCTCMLYRRDIQAFLKAHRLE